MTFWRAEIGPDGVGLLLLDVAGEAHNILRRPVLEELGRALEDVPRLKGLKGLVLASAKPLSFAAGADLREIEAIASPADGEAAARAGHRILAAVEAIPVPTVAAIAGPCLGGGLELALCCRYRVAADHPATRIGLPEVRLGIVPGLGGTQRLPRLVGLARGLEMILSGRALDARSAAAAGLVDRLAPLPLLIDAARRIVLEAPPLGRRRGRPSLSDRMAEGTPLGVEVSCRWARARAAERTKGRFPAVDAALDVVQATFGRPLEEGLEREAEAFGRLAASDAAKCLVRLFFMADRARKRRPVAASGRRIGRAAVLGAGTMGGGIALALAGAGIPVTLRDLAEAPLGAAMRHARDVLAEAVEGGRLTRREAERRLALVRPGLGLEGAAPADVVVEAVVEDLEAKRRALAEAEAAAPNAVLATATSSLSVAALAEGLRRPERLGGFHVFHPVHRMPLVEVVRAAATSDETAATLWDLALALGKTPILVADTPGFLVNRLLLPYVLEAVRLVEEGTPLEEVDASIEEFGMSVGPVALADEIGLDVAFTVAARLAAAHPDRMALPPLFEGVRAAGLLGRKGGAGFYLHGEAERRPNPALDAILSGVREVRGTAARAAGRVEILDRLLLPMAAEAARCLEEGVVDQPEEVDLAMVHGAGFPPPRGGPLRWADSVGAAEVVRRLEDLAERAGRRFDPGTPLRQVAAHGGFFR